MGLPSRDGVPYNDSSIAAPETDASHAATRLRLAAMASSEGAGSLDELQRAAAALVQELKSAKEPPEQVLLRIKRVLADAGLRPTYASPSDAALAIGSKATVYRDVIAWSIKHYYSDSQSNLA